MRGSKRRHTGGGQVRPLTPRPRITPAAVSDVAPALRVPRAWCCKLNKPRSKKDETAKPASAFKMAEGVRSVYRRAGIFVVSTKQLVIVMKGIAAALIKLHWLLCHMKLYKFKLQTPKNR